GSHGHRHNGRGSFKGYGENRSYQNSNNRDDMEHLHRHLVISSNSSSISQLVMNGVAISNVGTSTSAPIDIDDVILTVTGGGGDVEVVMCDTNVVVPLSASRLRLLQDTTMIESALDLDSLEESSVGAGSQAGLLKLNAVQLKN
ncbi:hypothetical protein L9F63_014559, partial [Diploptera punctata]